MTGYDYKQYYESEEFRRDCLDMESSFGAHYTPEATVFRTWAVKADKVSVCLFQTGTDMEQGAEQIGIYPMTAGTEPGRHATYECRIEGDWDGVYYTYLVEREGTAVQCTDPYAVAAGANGIRSMVAELSTTDPTGWARDKKWRQKNPNTVIYELHVKDFSFQEDSGVSKEHRGKYLAFTENSRAKKHLKKLGITYVHFLPMFDYLSVDETGDEMQFNWGYDPQNYNVPEGSYSTDCYHGKVRIRELKQMIQALHQAGIGVIMDVVYNHTYASDGAFHVLAPYYYYRQTEDGTWANGSGCGNETASERELCGLFIRRSLQYWAQEYHVDGFRFDLMALHDVETMNAIRADLDAVSEGKDILMYGEPWAAQSPAMKEGVYPADKGNLWRLDKRIAIFSDDTRDTIKGSVFYAKEPGFVNGGKGMEQRLCQSFQAWCGSHLPHQIISYVSVHDNYTLWDKLVLTLDEKADFTAADEKVLDANKMTAAIVYTGLGIPLMQAGEEFGRTKLGDENSYHSSPLINCLDWKRADAFAELTEYYKGLIALRGQIALYRDNSAEAVKRMQPYLMEEQLVVMQADNSGYGEKKGWDSLCIICNGSDRERTLELPDGCWEKLVDKNSSLLWKKKSIWSKIGKKERQNGGRDAAQGQISVPQHSVTVYGRKRGK